MYNLKGYLDFYLFCIKEKKILNNFQIVLYTFDCSSGLPGEKKIKFYNAF